MLQDDKYRVWEYSVDDAHTNKEQCEANSELAVLGDGGLIWLASSCSPKIVERLDGHVGELVVSIKCTVLIVIAAILARMRSDRWRFLTRGSHAKAAREMPLRSFDILTGAAIQSAVPKCTH